MKNRTNRFLPIVSLSHCHMAVFLFLLLSTGSILAQQLTPFVISSSVGFYSNTSGTLSVTTGEMTAIETYFSPNTILTQGFEQPTDFGTYTIEYPDPNFSFGIFPNPSDGNFNLVVNGEVNKKINLKILDIAGKVIQRTAFYHQGNTNVYPFDLTNAAPGIYLIVVNEGEINPFISGDHYAGKIQIVR